MTSCTSWLGCFKEMKWDALTPQSLLCFGQSLQHKSCVSKSGLRSDKTRVEECRVQQLRLCRHIHFSI